MPLRATTNFLSPHWPGKAKLSAAVHNHFFRCFSENEMPASLSFAELVDFRHGRFDQNLHNHNEKYLDMKKRFEDYFLGWY